jgi:hypothetical protein
MFKFNEPKRRLIQEHVIITSANQVSEPAVYPSFTSDVGLICESFYGLAKIKIIEYVSFLCTFTLYISSHISQHL